MTQTILSLGPCLFNWKAEDWQDFYFKIADESPFDEVYLGEVICSKRLPFYEKVLESVIQRLTNAGKTVIRPTLSLVMNAYEEKAVADICQNSEYSIEANDVSALRYLKNKPHRIGPFINVYNEDTARFMQSQGATRICLPYELDEHTIKTIVAGCDIEIEVQVFGRMPLALSSRCYHARSRNLRKSNCNYVCGDDYDGMDVQTLENQSFLTVNGTCTMSNSYVSLTAEASSLIEAGIQAFRLSPQYCDMVSVANIWQKLLQKDIDSHEADHFLVKISPDVAFSNGFFHHAAGRDFLIVE